MGVVPDTDPRPHDETMAEVRFRISRELYNEIARIAHRKGQTVAEACESMIEARANL